MQKLVIIPSLAFCLFVQCAFAQTFSSGDQKVPLIELFTSEGCSSCPPADRYLTKLSEEDGLWRDFVPVAFHVDYWDYIGWEDPYAEKAYSQRQRRYAAEYGESTVYTPGMRKAGEEWRLWRLLGGPELDEENAVGKLTVSVEEGVFKAQFDGSSTESSLQLTVALLGLDLSSEVTRGENRGKTLEHDFVVLGISTFSSATAGEWSGQIPSPSTPAPNYAIAAWVTQGASQTPIQATGGEINLPEPLALR